MKKPGIIVFNNTANHSLEHRFVFRFINELQSGILDGLNHKIYHVCDENGSGWGMSFEIVE